MPAVGLETVIDTQGGQAGISPESVPTLWTLGGPVRGLAVFGLLSEVNFARLRALGIAGVAVANRICGNLLGHWGG